MDTGDDHGYEALLHMIAHAFARLFHWRNGGSLMREASIDDSWFPFNGEELAI